MMIHAPETLSVARALAHTATLGQHAHRCDLLRHVQGGSRRLPRGGRATRRGVRPTTPPECHSVCLHSAFPPRGDEHGNRSTACTPKDSWRRRHDPPPARISSSSHPAARVEPPTWDFLVRNARVTTRWQVLRDDRGRSWRGPHVVGLQRRPHAHDQHAHHGPRDTRAQARGSSSVPPAGARQGLGDGYSRGLVRG